MIIHLHIIGWLLIVLALVHIIFPKYFKWENELTKLSLINRQMMQVHTFFIALVVLMIGLLCAFEAKDLVHTQLGQTICGGLAVFWAIRLVFQLFIYSPQLWRGKRFETLVHILFSCFWMYMLWAFARIAS